MIRYSYNQQVHPPAPFIHLQLVNPATRAALPSVPAQLDTAADVTVIPLEAAEELGLVQADEAEAVGLGGRAVLLPTFVVQVEIHDLPPVALEVLADEDEPYVLLGRDVLNRHRVTLDGPGLSLEFH